jgi:hypothetical protein
MPRARWTTAEQFNWLEAQMPKFLQAVGRDATSEFYKQTKKDFWEKWPLQPVTQAEIDEAGSVEKAEAPKREKTNSVRRLGLVRLLQDRMTYLNPEAPLSLVS